MDQPDDRRTGDDLLSGRRVEVFEIILGGARQGADDTLATAQCASRLRIGPGVYVCVPVAGRADPAGGAGVPVTASLGWDQFWKIAFDPRVVSALQLSFGAAVLAAVVNTIFGVLVAWVLVRYRFPGPALA